MSHRYGRIVTLCLTVVLTSLPGLALDVEPSGSAEPDLVGPQIILASQKPPVFPPAAMAGRISGSVMVEATVQPDGKVGEVKVLECSAPKVGFEQAAIDAVKKWRFEPGTRDGEPVPFSLKFRLNFRRGGQAPSVSAGSFTTSASDGEGVTRSTGVSLATPPR